MKRKLNVGDCIEFVSGNFSGLEAKIIETNYNSTHPNAIFGYYHTVLLQNGNIAHIEKSEHWQYI